MTVEDNFMSSFIEVVLSKKNLNKKLTTMNEPYINIIEKKKK